MVEGILVVNLDPPYIGFVKKESMAGAESKRLRGALKNCTANELRQLLIELGAITDKQQWPPRDCTMRVPGTYPAAILAKMGLAVESAGL